MDKIEYRAVIKFFVKEGLTPNETEQQDTFGQITKQMHKLQRN
jgi:hypothetical protein